MSTKQLSMVGPNLYTMTNNKWAQNNYPRWVQIFTQWLQDQRWYLATLDWSIQDQAPHAHIKGFDKDSTSMEPLFYTFKQKATFWFL
jgi:3-oxoacyl-[acyl-carrier-protein] synthase III